MDFGPLALKALDGADLPFVMTEGCLFNLYPAFHE
jgi:hypothetical protein